MSYQRFLPIRKMVDLEYAYECLCEEKGRCWRLASYLGHLVRFDYHNHEIKVECFGASDWLVSWLTADGLEVKRLVSSEAIIGWLDMISDAAPRIKV